MRETYRLARKLFRGVPETLSNLYVARDNNKVSSCVPGRVSDLNQNWFALKMVSQI